LFDDDSLMSLLLYQAVSQRKQITDRTLDRGICHTKGVLSTYK